MHVSQLSPALIKVVIVDDDPLVVRLLRLHAENYGFTVDACTASDEALETVQEGGVDILVTDLNMPGMSGWDLIKKVRATEDGAFIRIIVVSGEVSDMDKTLADDLDCDAIFEKQTIEMTNLVNKIEELALDCRNAKQDASWENFAKSSDIFR